MSSCVKFPCDVGDTVYVYRDARNKKAILEYKVEGFYIGKDGVFILCRKIGSTRTLRLNAYELGEVFFLTPEEANVKLQKEQSP